MKCIKLLSFVLLFSITGFGQIKYTDKLLENSIFTSVPEEVKSKKPFARQWWFYEQRAFPNDFIPENAYQNAIIQRDAQRVINGTEDITWVSLGPTPGAYFGYGNISSRIVTGTYHPTNPNIIYIGPANGGVWKSTDAGVNWQPLTDDQPSLAMGSIVLDPSNPNIVYAGTGEATYSGASYYGRGLLKSTDAGATWVHITSGLPSSSYFSRLIIRPNHSSELLAALGTSGLYRSTNSGVTWSQLVAGRCDDVLFSETGDTAFAIGSGIGGLRRSTDGGVTFSTFGSGLASGTRTHFDYCLTNPSVMYAAVYSGSSVSPYKSTDYGANWSVGGAGLTGGGQAWYDLHCKVNPWNPDHVYIGIIDVFRSTNGGTSFTNITNGYAGGNVHVDQHNLFFHPTDQNTFIVTNDGGIWRTTNNGNSFVNMNQNLTLTQFYRIAASPFDPGRILGGTQDNGTQQTFSTLNWAAAFGGDGGEVSFNHMVSNDQNIIGESQNGGLVRTTNGGTSWTNATTGINLGENVAWVAPIVKHPNISSYFYVARQRIYRTTDYGATWTAISANVNGSNAVRELAQSNSNSNIMYATTGSQVFKSTDEGFNWNNVTAGLPARTITSVYVHPTNADTAFLTFSGFGTDKVYKTTNGGTSWVSIHGNLPDSPVNDIYIYTYDAQNPNTYFVATDVGVFLTRDDGATWTEIADGLPNTVVLHLDYSHSNQMLRAGTHGRGVYEAVIDFTIPVELSSFNANIVDKEVVLNWITATETNNKGFEVERKLKNNEWESIGFEDGKGTSTEIVSYNFNDNFNDISYSGRVLYRLKQLNFDGSFEHSKIIYVDVDFTPQTYNLSQNYPNPFNPVTNIKYSVPLESEVKLVVLNSLGQEVAQLVSGIKSEGFYEVSWDADEFASGVYFYTINALSTNKQLSFTDTKKLLLVK